jgi:hypothetical protein
MFELEWQDEGEFLLGKMLCVKGEVPKASSYNAFYECGLSIAELLITWAEKQKGYSYAMDMHGSEYDEVDWPKIVVEKQHTFQFRLYLFHLPESDDVKNSFEEECAVSIDEMLEQFLERQL